MERNWFPAILIGLTVALGLVFLVIFSPEGREFLQSSPTAQEEDRPAIVVTEGGYTAAVTTVLEAYQESNDAKGTYDALIQLRVPASMLNVHYELVIAFGKLVARENADAEARLTALKAQYPWLPL